MKNKQEKERGIQESKIKEGKRGSKIDEGKRGREEETEEGNKKVK